MSSRALTDGWHFAGLHATGRGALVRTLLVATDGATRLETTATDGNVPSIVDIAAADWDERGRRPVRNPLRRPRAAPTARRPRPRPHALDGPCARPARQIAVGAIHAGVIESEPCFPRRRRPHPPPRRATLLQAPRPRARREGKTLDEGSPQRLRRAVTVTRSPTRTRARRRSASRQLPSSPVPERSCSSARRLWSHFNDIAAVCAASAWQREQQQFAALTERASLNATLTGHRFLFGSVRVGGSDLALGSDIVRAARDEVVALHTESARSWREASSTPPSRTGSPTSESSPRRMGQGSAPSARPRVRRGWRGCPRGEQTALLRLPRAHRSKAGCRRRARPLRAAGARTPADLRPPRTAARPPSQPSRRRGRPAEQHIGVGRVESPRGATRHHGAKRQTRAAPPATDRLVRELARRRPRRRRQPPPDFPLINKSFALCYACADR